MAFANWWFCISVGVKPLSPASSIAHAVFTGLGFVCYFGIASPLLYYPHLYRERLRLWDKIVNKPRKSKEYGKRTWRSHTIIGVWVSFLAALPRFAVEIHIVSTYGWLYVLQGVAILTTFLTITCGFLAVWGTYLWKSSKMFQTMSLNSMSHAERGEYLNAYVSGPYAVRYDAKGAPEWATGESMPSFVMNKWFYTYYPDADQGGDTKEGVITGGHLSRGDLRERKQPKTQLEIRHPVGMAFIPTVVDPDLVDYKQTDYAENPAADEGNNAHNAFSRGGSTQQYPPHSPAASAPAPLPAPLVPGSNPLSYIPQAPPGMYGLQAGVPPARSATSTTQ